MPSILMLLGRLLLSAIFIQAGLWKLQNADVAISYFQSVGLPFASILVWPVIFVELLGGIAIFLGYRVIIAAPILAAFTLSAALIGHHNFADIVDFQAFMKDLAIAGGLLYVAANGTGLISLDARRGV
ncbi:DoxX family protein [Rhizobium alvei]|uniref:DoxX family protein n=1 Tax=Rhizobium alvei TaxID=1132659 RepID=A0ABT8YPF0_9HYPH|nr:DoxX family protein [Rhizobium alvei]MDO6965577.1 DoxX family protein [Rhizobium alvei]